MHRCSQTQMYSALLTSWGEIRTKNTRQISHAETTEQEQNELLKKARHPLSCIISGSLKYFPVSKSDNTALHIL